MAYDVLERHLNEFDQDGPQRVEQVPENGHPTPEDQPKNARLNNGIQISREEREAGVNHQAAAAGSTDYLVEDTHQASSTKRKHQSQWAVMPMEEYSKQEYKRILNYICDSKNCAHSH